MEWYGTFRVKAKHKQHTNTMNCIVHVQHRPGALVSEFPALQNRLVGLVDKASASSAEDPRLESCFRRDFSGSSHTNDFKIGTPVATLPGAWRYRVSAGIGQPGVSIL